MQRNDEFFSTKNENRELFFKKLACFMGKRVPTPTFGDTLQKSIFKFSESQEKEGLSSCDLAAFKKEKNSLFIKHPKISRKSPLFDKFGKREVDKSSDESSIIQTIKDFNADTHDKRLAIITRKREFSAKHPRNNYIQNADVARLMTPQAKKSGNEKKYQNFQNFKEKTLEKTPYFPEKNLLFRGEMNEFMDSCFQNSENKPISVVKKEFILRKRKLFVNSNDFSSKVRKNAIHTDNINSKINQNKKEFEEIIKKITNVLINLFISYNFFCKDRQ